MEPLQEKIKRPPNAYILFCKDWRKVISAIYRTESGNSITLRLGYMWQALPSEEKEKYFSLSREAVNQHKQRYPGYRYDPTEAKRAKAARVAARRIKAAAGHNKNHEQQAKMMSLHGLEQDNRILRMPVAEEFPFRERDAVAERTAVSRDEAQGTSCVQEFPFWERDAVAEGTAVSRDEAQGTSCVEEFPFWERDAVAEGTAVSRGEAQGTSCVEEFPFWERDAVAEGTAVSRDESQGTLCVEEFPHWERDAATEASSWCSLFTSSLLL